MVETASAIITECARVQPGGMSDCTYDLLSSRRGAPRIALVSNVPNMSMLFFCQGGQLRGELDHGLWIMAKVKSPPLCVSVVYCCNLVVPRCKGRLWHSSFMRRTAVEFSAVLFCRVGLILPRPWREIFIFEVRTILCIIMLFTALVVRLTVNSIFTTAVKVLVWCICY